MKKTKKEIEQHEREMAVLSSADRLNRARSLTVGTAFNGTTEIMMRGDGKYLWCLLQPTEVTEIIHQLAANIGCHINIQPRNDFGSWRKWNDQEVPMIGTVQDTIPRPQPTLTNMTKELQHEPSVATKKTVKR